MRYYFTCTYISIAINSQVQNRFNWRSVIIINSIFKIKLQTRLLVLTGDSKNVRATAPNIKSLYAITDEDATSFVPNFKFSRIIRARVPRRGTWYYKNLLTECYVLLLEKILLECAPRNAVPLFIIAEDGTSRGGIMTSYTCLCSRAGDVFLQIPRLCSSASDVFFLISKFASGVLRHLPLCSIFAASYSWSIETMNIILYLIKF